MSKSTAIANRDRVSGILDRMAPQMASILPRHLKPERMAKLFLIAASKTPKIAECSPTSIMQFMMVASELGLEPGSALGHLYPIPYGRELTAVIGYKGFCELARRSGQVKRINADVVYQAELDEGLFKVTREPPDIQHGWSPSVGQNPGPLVAAYAVVELNDGSRVQVILSAADIAKRKAKSKTAGRTDSPWNTDKPAMWRKSAIRALLSGGLVPLSAEMSRAVEVEREVETITVEEVPLSLMPTEPSPADEVRAAIATNTDTDADAAAKAADFAAKDDMIERCRRAEGRLSPEQILKARSRAGVNGGTTLSRRLGLDKLTALNTALRAMLEQRDQGPVAPDLDDDATPFGDN